jgi:hypothetical protein
MALVCQRWREVWLSARLQLGMQQLLVCPSAARSVTLPRQQCTLLRCVTLQWMSCQLCGLGMLGSVLRWCVSWLLLMPVMPLRWMVS